VVFIRYLIGHTRLTHTSTFLLKGEGPAVGFDFYTVCNLYFCNSVFCFEHSHRCWHGIK